MKSFTLIAGKPPEPSYTDILHATTPFPVPDTLLRPLFAERCGIDVSQCQTTEEAEERYLTRIQRGFCGTPAIGYRWENYTSLDSSADPIEEHVTTYNLPGIRIDWHYAWRKAGQLGHCAYWHRSLQVEFDDEAAQNHFEHLWQRAFSTSPTWQPAEYPNDVGETHPEA